MQAAKTSGVIPTQITTDKEPALYAAIDNVFDGQVKHRDSKYKNNCLEQDHRGPKSRLSVMKGFKNIFCALRFCTVFDEVRQLFKMKDKTRAERRSLFLPKFQEFNNLALNAA